MQPRASLCILCALDVLLALPPGATRAQIYAAMRDHVIAEMELMGRYGRS